MTSHQTANQLGVCNQQHSVSLVATDNKMLHWQKDLTQIVRYIIYWWYENWGPDKSTGVG